MSEGYPIDASSFVDRVIIRKSRLFCCNPGFSIDVSDSRPGENIQIGGLDEQGM